MTIDQRQRSRIADTLAQIHSGKGKWEHRNGGAERRGGPSKVGIQLVCGRNPRLIPPPAAACLMFLKGNFGDHPLL